MFSFSPNLINRTVRHFKKKYNLDISAETASEYLDGFSGLFLAFVEINNRRTAHRADGGYSASLQNDPAFPKPEAGPRLERSEPIDLITPHNTSL